MMMSDLPTDLVEEILSRVIATSLKRLRTTCKLWNGLLKDTGFTEKHLRKARKQSLVLMLKEGMISSVSVNLNVSPPSVEFTGTLGLTDSHSKSEQVDIFTVHDHCDGLLLCSTNDNRLVVWNPCLGVTTWMQHKSGHSKYSSFALGYRNNKTCHSYKILKWDYLHQFEIYAFCSNSWRVLNDVKQQCFSVSGNGVFLKGKMYSIARSHITYEYFVLCFDFTTEKFKHMCLPAVSGKMDLSVVGEEQLSLVNQSSDLSKLKIWVTTKIDTEAALSWSVCFTVDLNTLGILYSGLLIDDEEKKVALCCFREVDDTYNGVIDMEDFICWPSIFGYVPSLVQIQQDKRQTKKELAIHPTCA